VCSHLDLLSYVFFCVVWFSLSVH